MNPQTLEPPELDYYVAKIEGHNPEIIDGECGIPVSWYSGVWKGRKAWCRYTPILEELIDKYHIDIEHKPAFKDPDMRCWAGIEIKLERGWYVKSAHGSTSRIAAMRALMAAKWRDEDG